MHEPENLRINKMTVLNMRNGICDLNCIWLRKNAINAVMNCRDSEKVDELNNWYLLTKDFEFAWLLYVSVKFDVKYPLTMKEEPYESSKFFRYKQL